MKCNVNRIGLGLMCTLFLVPPVFAQVPSSEVDTHIATAKAAAGLDYRGTFVNLCLPGGAPGGAPAAARGAAAPARGAAGNGGGRGGGGTPATPDRSGWYASPYKVFDNLYW